MIVAERMPAWLAARCMRVLDAADRQEDAAGKFSAHPDTAGAAVTNLRFSDSLRADVAAVAGEWRHESPPDA